MTKPIEGWVEMDPYDNVIGFSFMETLIAPGTVGYDLGYKCRPVLLTLADEANRVEDAVPEDERIVAAIRKDRERIWEWLDSNGILFLLKTYCPASMKYNEETEQNIKRAIFGEEK